MNILPNNSIVQIITHRSESTVQQYAKLCSYIALFPLLCDYCNTHLYFYIISPSTEFYNYFMHLSFTLEWGKEVQITIHFYCLLHLHINLYLHAFIYIYMLFIYIYLHI